MILENKALVIDFGMCLRIPYAGDSRHLISRQIPAGKKVDFTRASFLT